MKKIPKAVYKSAEELRIEIERREAALELLPEGEVRRTLEMQLRSYAEMKQVLAVR